MKLGVAAEVWHTAGDLDESARFYRTLGLTVIERSGVLSILCGSLHLKLANHEFPSPTLAYRTENVERVAEDVAGLGVTVKEDPDGFLILGPEMERVLLLPIEGVDLIAPPEPISSSLVLPTTQVKRALTFWRALGFLRIGGNVLRPDQWATVYDGRIPISLVPTVSVARPSIWFSEGLSDEQRKGLEAAGFDGAEEAASRKREILFSPEQQPLIFGQLL